MLDVHRSTCRGIIGSKYYGAESIRLGDFGASKTKPAICPNYDERDHILFSGSGRSLPQTSANGNGALMASCALKQPVRVMRRAGCSKFGPKSGINYDGLYYVIEWCYQKGKYYFELARKADSIPRFIKVMF